MTTVCLQSYLFIAFPVDNPSVSLGCPWLQDPATVTVRAVSFESYCFNFLSFFDTFDFTVTFISFTL